MDNQGSHRNESSDEGNKSTLSRYSLLFALLIILMLFVFFSVQNQKIINTKPISIEKPTDANMPRLIKVSSGSPETNSFIIVKTGTAGRNDLFLCKLNMTRSCTNITNTPSIDEIWPIVNNSGKNVVYYGANDSGTDIYWLELPNGFGRPLTIQAGKSKLHTEFAIVPNKEPEISPDEQWVAFPAKSHKNNCIELFVVRNDGQIVIQVTNIGNKVKDYTWLNSTTLLITILRPDGEIQYLRCFNNSNSFYTEVLNIDNY